MQSIEFFKNNIDYIIFSILGCMSFLTVTFSIERAIFYSHVNFTLYEDKDECEEALTKNLIPLYIIYQNAPYVGLLGTIAGIMVTFYDMGTSGNLDPFTIMIGLSLALKATALGLIVAIPTLIIYNLFIRKVDILLNQYAKKSHRR